MNELDADMLDVDSISSQSSNSIVSSKAQILSDANLRVLQYINTSFEQIISALSNGSQDQKPPVVTLKRLTSFAYQSLNHVLRTTLHGEQRDRTNAHRSVTYSWPGRTEYEAWQFACLLAVLSEIKSAIEKGVTVTKRDIYYRQPDLFGKQETVDRFVDDIAFTCDVTRKDLNVTASPKGLFCGLNLNDEVLIVPEDLSPFTPDVVSPLRWIFVVEKEASFKTLVEHSIQTLPVLGRGLIVTGKGYPDINTKQFLRHVCDLAASSIPVFGLFDGDPDGLDIYRSYRTGSKRLSHESSCNIPEMRHIGVDIGEFLNEVNVMNAASSMTLRDRVRARSMLGRRRPEASMQQQTSGDEALRARRMLQLMLMLNVKMEIQAIEHVEGGLCGWFAQKLSP